MESPKGDMYVFWTETGIQITARDSDGNIFPDEHFDIPGWPELSSPEKVKLSKVFEDMLKEVSTEGEVPFEAFEA